MSSSISAENVQEQAQVEQDIKDLHGLGYRQTLRRTIGSFTSFALGFAMEERTRALG